MFPCERINELAIIYEYRADILRLPKELQVKKKKKIEDLLSCPKGCRSRPFLAGARAVFWLGSGSYSIVNILFLRDRKYE